MSEVLVVFIQYFSTTITTHTLLKAIDFFYEHREEPDYEAH